MKDVVDWHKVNKKYKETHSKRQTAKELGISRNTVRRLLEMKEEPRFHPREYKTKIDPYKDLITEWYVNKDLIGTRIFRDLCKFHGYEGSIHPVYLFLGKLDEAIKEGKISRKASVPENPLPGDQAQFDWSEYREVKIGGVPKTVYCFSMILAFSRKKAICFSLRQDADAIYEAIQELFSDLGGVTQELLIDNPKALVLENETGDPLSENEIKYNPNALTLSIFLDTALNACPYYWPREKGKVERPFQYIEEQFVKGNEFANMEDLNRRAKDFIKDWNGEVHKTTLRIPNEYYLEEEDYLLPLPKKRWYRSLPESRKVNPYSRIHIDTNQYSVPVEYVGRKVYYRLIYGFRIQVYDKIENGKLIHTVEAVNGRHEVLDTDGHRDAIEPKQRRSIPETRREFQKRYPVNSQRFMEAAGQHYGQPAFAAGKVMQFFGDLYPDDLMDRLIGAAVDQNRIVISDFRAMILEYNSGQLPLSGSETKKSAAPPAEAPADDGEHADAPADTGEAGLTRDCDYYEEVLSGQQ